MAKKKQDEIEEKKDRSSAFSKSIEKRSIRSKIKLALLAEYKKGHFYTIPRCLFDTNNNEDRKLIEMLKQLYRESNQEDQAIPEGLFDLTSEEERREFLEILLRKKYKVVIDFSFVPEGLCTKEELAELEKIRSYNRKMKEIIHSRSIRKIL